MNRPLLQVAHCTGPVDPQSCALDERKRRFFDRLHLPAEVHCVEVDFPYIPALRPAAPVPLWLASLRNVNHFIRARTRGGKETSGWSACTTALIDQAHRTLFIAGSCGLELLASLRLEPRHLARCHVIGLGPVARSPLRIPSLTTVRGRTDWLSFLFFPQVDHAVSSGHLGYLDHPDVLALCRNHILHELETARHAFHGSAPPAL